MKLHKSLLILGLCFLLAAPAFAVAEEEITVEKEMRAKAANMYADDAIKTHIMQASFIDTNWLNLLQKFSKTPDARLFFLAMGAIPDHKGNNETTLYSMPFRYSKSALEDFSFAKLNENTTRITVKHIEYSKYLYTYTAIMNENGELWCVKQQEPLEYEWRGYFETEIWRLKNGVLKNVTPEHTNIAEFYNNFENRFTNFDDFLFYNDLHVDFAVDITEIPFKLTARLVNHRFPKYKYYDVKQGPSYEIRYLWNGTQYIQDEKITINKQVPDDLRNAIADMYANKEMADLVRTSTGIDPDWFYLMQKYAKEPDARLFFLANISHFEENSLWPGFPDLQPQYYESYEWNQPTNKYVEVIETGGSAGNAALIQYDSFNAEDGSVWCLVDYHQYSKFGGPRGKYIYRFYNGKIYDLSPKDLKADDFFIDGLPEYPPDPYKNELFWYGTHGLGDCKTFVNAEVDKSTIPFKIKVILDYAKYNSNMPTYICVPQCYFEYNWDGMEYVRGERICLENNWGFFAPEL